MMTRNPIPTASLIVLATIMFSISNTAGAHMPWLSTDQQGHAVLWFGESPADRTYHMPAPIAAIKLRADQTDQALGTVPVDSDELVGLRSKTKLENVSEIAGSVTYGLYHGTKLTYHVEHLLSKDASTWPTEAREKAAYQTVITPGASGGVSVMVLAGGKPLRDVEVKLFCEDGHEEAAAKTDIAGIVTFSKKSIEPGLNAVLVSIADADAKGDFSGEPFSSTTDIVTATFLRAGSSGADQSSKSNEKKTPKVDPNSGASIVPSNLPELPEELTSFGAAILDQKLFVYGGHTGSAHSYSTEEQSDRLWSLDLSHSKSNGWEKLAAGPKLQGLALVAHDGGLIRIGGFTAKNDAGEEHVLESQSSVARFNPSLGTWTDLPSLPEPRSSLDAAVLGDTVYVFGGWQLDGGSGSSKWLQTACSLDLSDGDSRWKMIAKPPFQRRAISSAAHDGKLFVIGGMQPKGGPTTKVDIYDPKTDTWSTGTAIPGSGMSGFGSSSFATGGELFVSTMDGFLHQLSDDHQSWKTIAKSDPARFFHRMLPESDRALLMVGGANMEIGKFTEIDRIQIK